MTSLRENAWLSLETLAVILFGAAACACDCQKGRIGHAGAMPGYGGPFAAVPAFDYGPAAFPPGPAPMHGFGAPPFAPPMGEGLAQQPVGPPRLPPMPPPPPGTVGTTYFRRSALLPPNEHPRSAAVDVYNVGAEALVASPGLKAKWLDDRWQLMTEAPLIPGLPHIYAVTVAPAGGDLRTGEVRYVRLIMGRVVDLEF